MKPLIKPFLLCLCALSGTMAGYAAPLSPSTTPFFLHDGDRVVFYGDSITEQQMYARDVETFVLTRYPSLHVHFINSGWGGDRVTGGGGGPIDLRLTRDVVNYKPTVVTVFLGMNDGGYVPYNAGTFQGYASGLTHIVDRLQKELPGVRLTLITPSYFDYAAKPRDTAVTHYDYSNPAPDYNATLLRYGDFVKRLGAERHIPVVDTNAPMAAATAEGRKTDPAFSLFRMSADNPGDGVHPNDAGHAIIAAAILKAWHIPAIAFPFAIHIANQPLLMLTFVPAGKTDVSEPSLSRAALYHIAFPTVWPVPDSAKPAFGLSPLVASYTRYTLYVPFWTGKEATATTLTHYTLFVDGRIADTLSRQQLMNGLDLSYYRSLPQNVQAQTVLALVQKRINTWHDFWKGKNGLVSKADAPTEDELAALRAKDTELNALREQARTAAHPQTHTFSIKHQN